MGERPMAAPGPSSRKKPNILITGTPGTGKSSTAELAAAMTGLQHIDVSKMVVEKGLHEGYDEEFQTHLIDDDKVVDELEEITSEGGTIIDTHSLLDYMPERWFDLCVVLRTKNEVLYPRLEARGYSDKKIQENVECEIMEVVAEEARESYKQEIYVEFDSNTADEMELNADKLKEWIDNWQPGHSWR